MAQQFKQFIAVHEADDLKALYSLQVRLEKQDCRRPDQTQLLQQGALIFVVVSRIDLKLALFRNSRPHLSIG